MVIWLEIVEHAFVSLIIEKRYISPRGKGLGGTGTGFHLQKCIREGRENTLSGRYIVSWQFFKRNGYFIYVKRGIFGMGVERGRMIG